jgi:hypothetical protein
MRIGFSPKIDDSTHESEHAKSVYLKTHELHKSIRANSKNSKLLKFSHKKGDQITATINTYSGNVEWKIWNEKSGKEPIVISYDHKEILESKEPWFFTVVLSNGQKI